jgi:hypothetical protein
MDMFRRDKIPDQWPGTSSINRNFSTPCPVADDPGIPGCQFERDVSGDGCQGLNLQSVRSSQCKQNGDGVILTRISIDDNRLRTFQGGDWIPALALIERA